MTAHAFEADPLSLQGDCAFCGLPHPDYGDEPVLDYDVPAPSSCTSCRHYSHREPCDAVVSGWSQRACGCRAVAA